MMVRVMVIGELRFPLTPPHPTLRTPLTYLI